MTDAAALSHVFKALGHPRRVRILSLLCDRPELGRSRDTLLTASRMPSASFDHHMRELRAAGLVQTQRRGGARSFRPVDLPLRAALGDAAALLPGPARAA